MSFRSRMAWGVCVGVLAAAGGPARGAFFSFASDDTDQAPSFVGSAGVGSGSGSSFSITSPLNNTFNLLIDDSNGPRPALSIPVRMVSNLTAVAVTTGGFGMFITYNYGVSGTVDFVDAFDVLLMRIAIASGNGAAVMTVPGTASQWGTAGAIIGSDTYSQIDYIVTAAGFANFSTTAANLGQPISGYGILAPGTSGGPDDFGFTLTALMTQQGGGAVTLNQDKLPSVAWTAESSYSGSSGTIVPSPGAGLLLAGAGLGAARRRRR